MSGVQISQVRWPVELYEWLQERAYRRRQSINKTIIEVVEIAKKQEEVK
ncbi:MAG: Arc family DNA-binding protein [Synergistaceae bacterium]|nr:Arc family DNA-binding protein [Synergistaceae bacterium]